MTMACGLDLHSTSDHVRCGGGGVRRGVEGPVVAAGSGALSTVVARRRDASGARRPGGVGGGGLHRLAAAHHYGQPGDLASIAASAAATRAAIDALDRGDHDLAARLWESGTVQRCSTYGIAGTRVLARLDRAGTRLRLNPSAQGPRACQRRCVPGCTSATATDADTAGSTSSRGRRDSPIVRLVSAFPALTPGLTVVSGALRGSGRSGAIRNVDYSKFLWSMTAPEHVFPRSLGGPTDEENDVTACWGCNAWKGDLTLEQLGVAFRV